MQIRDKIYINGRWIPSLSSRTLAVINAATEETMGQVPDGTVEDVAAAVAAARDAFDAWATTPVETRAGYLEKISAGLTARTDEIARSIAGEVGMPLKMSQRIQAGLPPLVMASYAKLVREYQFEEKIGNSLVVHEPVGVVGCITPWNYPLHQIAAKVAFAMAAGCTVVLKPSEVAPLDAFMLAEIIDEVGLPAGVFNMVTGTGPVVGEAIAGHPLVDMVSFTGSTRAGKRVMQVGAESIKRVALELGGKSANIIGEDLDAETFGKAVKSGVGKAFLNSGQTCSALTRMLVPKSRLAEAEEHAAAAASAMKPCDPFTEGMNLGPLASAAQRDRVNSYIQKGIDEGAKLLVGGVGVPEGVAKGYYVLPTVFSQVTTDMTIAKEEIFGPVLSIIAYNDIDDAVRIANATDFGLAGGVWLADKDKAIAVAKRMRTGQVEVNGGAFNPNAPFGGYKQSGNGREYGEYGFEEFLEIKSLQL